MATATQAETTDIKPTTGFAVPCPHCGAMEGLRVNCHDLSVECGECNNEVTRDDLHELVEAALRLIRWLDLASTL